MGALLERQIDAIMQAADDHFVLNDSVSISFRDAVRAALRLPELSDYGLQRVQPVRYIDVDKRKFPASVRGVNSDGSVEVIDKNTGASRSIPIERLEIQIVGPRGGKTWQPLTDHME